MKVQLQTNYSERNLVQKNKTASYNNPSFKGTWQIFVPVEDFSTIKFNRIWNELKDWGTILRGEVHNQNGWADTIKISCAKASDDIVKAKIEALKTWPFEARKPIRVYPLTDKHSLTEEQLANVQFELDPPSLDSQI